MTLGERIKKIRKENELTQQAFCDRIGLKRNSISLVESGKRNISAQAIKGICREFNVNEEWLKNGTGEMYNPSPDTVVDELAREYHLDDLDRAIVTEFIQLPEREREIVKKYVKRLAQSIPSHTQREIWEQEADEFAAMARQQFLEEKRRESQALSAGESDGSGLGGDRLA